MKYSELNLNKTNPFIDDALKRVSESTVKKLRSSLGNNSRAVTKLANVETGEVIVTSFVRSVELDAEKYTKVYNSEFKAFFGLSTPAIRTLGYIINGMHPKCDIVFFNVWDCMEYTGYTSKATVYRALTNLSEQGIIARGPSECTLFINPMVIFNGDRVRFVKEYVRNME